MNAEGRGFNPELLNAPSPEISREPARVRQVLDKATALFEAGRAKFRETADTVVKNIKGEKLPDEVEDYQHTWSDVGKAVATGVAGIGLMWTGTKIGVELPRYVLQKHYTKQEREDILWWMEFGTNTKERSRMVMDRIEESKYLTPKQKAELLQRVGHAFHEKKEEAGEEISELLDEAITTRVKGAVVVAESLNTLLIFTGVNALRTVGYGAVALYERHEIVSEELKSGKRTESYAKEFFVNGVKETFHNLRGGDAKTHIGKAMNFVKASTTVLRSLAVLSMSANEWHGGEGGIRATVDASLRALEEKGALRTAADHFNANAEHLFHLLRRGGSALGLVPSAHAGELGHPSPTHDVLPPPKEATVTAEGGADLAFEYSRDQIELGTPHTGDSFVGVLARQIEKEPVRFGFHGNENDASEVRAFAHDLAIQSSETAGILRPGGESWLTSKAVGHVSVLETVHDGKPDVTFFNYATNTEMSLSEARAAGFVVEHGTVPGEIPTRQEARDTQINRIFEGQDPVPVAKPGAIDRRVEGLGPEHALAVRRGPDGQPDAIVIDPGRLSRDSRVQADLLVGMRGDHQDTVSQAIAHAEKVRAEETLESAERLAVLSGVQRRLSETGAPVEHMEAVREAFLAEAHAAVSHYDATAGTISTVGQVTEAAMTATEAGEFAELMRIPQLIAARFIYDGAGRPIVDVDDLMEHAGRRARETAKEILLRDWRHKLADDSEGVTAVIHERAQAVFVFNLALKELEDKGAGEGDEAHFLREALRRELSTLGEFLDGNNPVVREAMQRAGIADASPESTRILSVNRLPPRAEISKEDWEHGLKLRALEAPEGKIRFAYDTVRRSVRSCVIEMNSGYDVTPDQALGLFGTSLAEVARLERRSGAFVEVAARERRSLSGHAQRYVRQTLFVNLLRSQGLDGTPEFTYLRQQTDALHDYISQEVSSLVGGVGAGRPKESPVGA